MIRDGIARQYKMLAEDFMQTENRQFYEAANHHLMLDLFSERYACMALWTHRHLSQGVRERTDVLHVQ